VAVTFEKLITKNSFLFDRKFHNLAGVEKTLFKNAQCKMLRKCV